MKELSNEEKIKRYDELSKEVKDFLKVNKKMCGDVTKALESLFPELVESEDEKIRKELLKSFREIPDGSEAYYSGLRVKDIISWLEKQGNDKPNFRERYKKMTESEWFKKTYEDKSCGVDSESVDEEPVENANEAKPEFKVGDWITFYGGTTFKIQKIKADGHGILNYLLSNQNGDDTFFSKKYVDENARLWTIEDAKDGDILAAYEYYVIFKEICDLNILCYCTCHLGDHPTIHINTLQNKTAFCPATKEERELFFEKMDEKGFIWDSEKKELFKLTKL